MTEQAHLVFRVSGCSFALDIRKVVKIHDLGQELEVPGWGEEVNLARFFGMEGGEGSRQPFRVDLEVEDYCCYFGADQVEDIRGFGLALYLEFPPLLRTEDNLTIQGFFFDGLRFIHQLDVAAMIASPRFQASLIRHGDRRS